MNIFEIEESLMDLYSQIEENGGEITPEIQEQLVISQDNFKEKVKGYTDVIKEINSSLDSIKCEKNRLKSLEDAKKRTKDNLTSIVAKAITMFGDTTKSGGKFIDFGTGKVNVRNNQTCNISDDKLDLFCKALIYYIGRCVSMNVRTIGNSPKNMIQEYLTYTRTLSDKLNAQISGEKVEVNDNEIPTTNDINSMEININIKLPVANILDNTNDTNLLFNLVDNFNIKPEITMSKTKIKTDINDGLESNYATVIPTQSLTIK